MTEQYPDHGMRLAPCHAPEALTVARSSGKRPRAGPSSGALASAIPLGAGTSRLRRVSDEH
jgi:hypothetical protein